MRLIAWVRLVLPARVQACVRAFVVLQSDGFVTVRAVGSFIMSGFMHISPVRMSKHVSPAMLVVAKTELHLPPTKPHGDLP